MHPPLDSLVQAAAPPLLPRTGGSLSRPTYALTARNGHCAVFSIATSARLDSPSSALCATVVGNREWSSGK